MTTLPTRPTAPRRPSQLLALAQLVRAELRRLVRNPMYAIGTIGFPVMFFALFGLPVIREVGPRNPNIGPVLLVQFAAYSLLSLAMFSFGAVVATERTGGWLRLLRSSPLPIPLYLMGRVGAALVFSAVCLLCLYTFAHFAAGVTLSLALSISVAVKLLLAMVPLIALGLCIGFLATPQAAQILANIVSVVMSFASGLFTPLNEMPTFVQRLAPFLPPYHVREIGANAATGHAVSPLHWLALLAFTLLFGALAVWGMKRDESREG